MTMKNINASNFIEQANAYLEQSKFSSSYNVYKSIVGKFLTFYENKEKPIDEYTKDDFKAYFQQSNVSAGAFAQIKSRLVDLLTSTNHHKVAQELRETRTDSLRVNYIKSFEELDTKIEITRVVKFPFLKDAPELNICDSLTLAQVVLYLAWVGVPQRCLTQILLPLTVINLEENVVDIGKKFYFGDNKKIVKVFSLYKNSTSFIAARANAANKNKSDIMKEKYYGDTLIRPSKESSEGNLASIATLVKNVTMHFSFSGGYQNIYKAGAFSRGYQKYQSGISPDFSSNDKIWDYFGIIIETASQAYSFKLDWNNYIEWRKGND